MAIMKIIHMSFMLDGYMSAAWTMLMISVLAMNLVFFCHCSLPFLTFDLTPCSAAMPSASARVFCFCGRFRACPGTNQNLA